MSQPYNVYMVMLVWHKYTTLRSLPFQFYRLPFAAALVCDLDQKNEPSKCYQQHELPLEVDVFLAFSLD
jgi:hypothetical protein